MENLRGVFENFLRKQYEGSEECEWYKAGQEPYFREQSFENLGKLLEQSGRCALVYDNGVPAVLVENTGGKMIRSVNVGVDGEGIPFYGFQIIEYPWTMCRFHGNCSNYKENRLLCNGDPRIREVDCDKYTDIEWFNLLKELERTNC
ncbi:MAG: hypothetical protein J4473_03225 [Candidatus Aenigmarchaeota archaeon]|nr:hypothetical protein [Candidatus Aenigmarchaeota archaeon]